MAGPAAVCARAEAHEPGDRDDGQHDQARDEDGRQQREEYEASEDSYDDVGTGSICVVSGMHVGSFG